MTLNTILSSQNHYRFKNSPSDYLKVKFRREAPEIYDLMLDFQLEPTNDNFYLVEDNVTLLETRQYLYGLVDTYRLVPPYDVEMQHPLVMDPPPRVLEEVNPAPYREFAALTNLFRKHRLVSMTKLECSTYDALFGEVWKQTKIPPIYKNGKNHYLLFPKSIVNLLAVYVAERVTKRKDFYPNNTFPECSDTFSPLEF